MNTLKLFQDVEDKHGKELVSRIRLAERRINAAIAVGDEEALYSVRQSEGLAVAQAMKNADSLSTVRITITRYSASSTQVEVRSLSGNLVWRDFTFANDFVFNILKELAYL